MAEPSKLSKNLGLAAVAIALVALSFFIYRVQTAGTRPPSLGPYFYSSDDGKSFYTSGERRIAPFTDGGKEVVSATVFVGADNKPFVGYIYKYNPEGQQMLEKATVDRPSLREDAAPFGLVKRPGDSQWIGMTSGQAQRIMNPIDPATKQPAKYYEPKNQ